MNKQIIIVGIILVISLVSLVSASSSKIRMEYDDEHWDLNFFSGETIINKFTIYNEYNKDKEIDLNYEVEGNSFNLEGITFEFSDDNFVLDKDEDKTITFTITSQPNYRPDSFTITISADDSNIDEEEDSHISGRGSCRIDKDFDWKCSEWSKCVDRKQTRTCRKYNNCGNTYGKPNMIRGCTSVEIEDTDIIIIDGVSDDETKTWKQALLGVWLLIVIFVVILIIYKITNAKKHKPKIIKEKKHNSKIIK